MKKEKYILLLHKKLSNQITLKEAKQLESWRKESVDNERLLKEMEMVYSKSKAYQPEVPKMDTQKAKEDFFKQVLPVKEAPPVYTLKRTTKRRLFPIFSPISIAAAIVLVIGSIFIFRQLQVDSIPEFMQVDEPLFALETKNSETKKLEDGSMVWLKPGSVFRYEEDFNTTDRTVYLQGELFIHVASNKEKPFVIKLEQNEVRVLGTAFYLRSDQEDLVTLKVEDGLVEFSALDGYKVLVKAGEEKVYSKKTGQFLNDNEQNPLVTNWRQNYLVFNDVGLLTVFDKLTIFYGVEFNISCKAIESMQGFTSPVQRSESPKLESFLRTLEMVYGISIDKIADNTFKVHGDPCK